MVKLMRLALNTSNLICEGRVKYSVFQVNSHCLSFPTSGEKFAPAQILLRKSDTLARAVALEYFTPLSYNRIQRYLLLHVGPRHIVERRLRWVYHVVWFELCICKTDAAVHSTPVVVVAVIVHCCHVDSRKCR